MTTAAQFTANARNAESSTGPTTEAGKQISAQNARTTGLYATPPNAILPHETEIWTDFVQSFNADLVPAGAIEQTMAQEITHAAWRLRRCNLLESSVENEAGQLQSAIDRARTSAQRAFHRNIIELRRLQTERQFRLEYFPASHDGSLLGLAATRELIPALQNLACFDPIKRETAVFNTFKNNAARPNWVRSEKTTIGCAQVPRSALCPCGSGQKFKRCCGQNAPAVLNTALKTAA